MDIKSFTDRYISEHNIAPSSALLAPQVSLDMVSQRVSTQRDSCPVGVSFSDIVTDVYYFIQRTGVLDEVYWNRLAKMLFWAQYEVCLRFPVLDFAPYSDVADIRGETLDVPTLSAFEAALLQEINTRGLLPKIRLAAGVDN